MEDPHRNGRNVHLLHLKVTKAHAKTNDVDQGVRRTHLVKSHPALMLVVRLGLSNSKSIHYAKKALSQERVAFSFPDKIDKILAASPAQRRPNLPPFYPGGTNPFASFQRGLDQGLKPEILKGLMDPGNRESHAQKCRQKHISAHTGGGIHVENHQRKR